MRISVRWASRIEFSTELDVELATLARWALTGGVVRKLSGTTLNTPTADELVDSMARNIHLRNAIAQQFAIAHELARTDPRSRRNGHPQSFT